MTRFVVQKDNIMGVPVYVAKDEADAAKYLDSVAEGFQIEQITRKNSLVLEVRESGMSYVRYNVVAVRSWE